MDNIATFQEEHPSLESYWRSVILFGRNVASYKFALAESLIDLTKAGKSDVTLDQLAVPYAKHLCEHLKTAPKQATSQSSRFLDACKQFNEGKITEQQLIATTVSLGFNNVIDAFHNVNNAELPVRFYEKDYNASSKRIILTDDVFKLGEVAGSSNFMHEAESRWNLVETAWDLGVSRNLLDVSYDEEKKMFFVNSDFKRRDVTSARGALNGYQKGKCFYCFADIVVSDDETNTCDVDHFYPHTLQSIMPDVNLDGVWNLVLACPDCNRGQDGKFAKVPHIKYLQRLHKRNEFLISSHHPLRETIMKQTGQTEADRVSYLQDVDKRAINTLIHRWETPAKGEEVF